MKKKAAVAIMMSTVMTASVFAAPSTVFGQTTDNTADMSRTVVKDLAPEAPEESEYVDTSAESAGYKSVDLRWKTASGAVGYNVYISAEENDGEFTLETTVGAGTSSYRFTNLDMNTQYLFLVEAFYSEEGKGPHSVLNSTVESEQGGYIDTGDKGENTVIDDEQVAAATPTLEAPQVDAYINTTTSATVEWEKVEGASGYYVYKKNQDTGKFSKVKTVESGSTTSWSQDSLAKGETHQYRVKAYRIVNEGNLSGEAGSDSTETPKVLKRSSKDFSKTYAAKILKKGETKLGKPYVFGASGPNSFDCSGFVYWTLKNSKVDDVSISRTSAQGIYNKYKKYNIGKSLSKAQPGDIILFSKGRRTTGIYHAGLYYGNNKQIHATTGRYNGIEIDGMAENQIAAIIRMPGLE